MQIDSTRNYFELFGLPAGFEIDVQALTERYRDLQRSVHPDRFTNATDRERRLSMQQASLINEAYQSLKEPLKRARYLLSLNGVDINDESNTIMDTTFLMQQMELRETLEEIGSQPDPMVALEDFAAEVGSMIRDLISQLSTCFDDNSESALNKAHGLSLQLQFLYRLREEVEEHEEALL